MKIGIAGVGFMGSVHAEGWAATPAEIAGFVASEPASAQAVAARYGARVYPTLEAMLAEVDVVDICTPTHLHAPMVEAAAAAGVHVVCEKPLARTLEQGRRVVSACRSAGVQLFAAHVVRFFPEYAQAREAVQRGDIGAPAVIRLSRGSYRPKLQVGNWFLDAEKSGGMIIDLMIHDLDYARWVAGDVTQVFARSVGNTHPGAEIDYAMAILTHASGAISHVTGAWAYPPPTFRTSLEIAGDGGLIEHSSAQTAPIEQLLRRDESAPDVGLPASPLRESPYTTQIKEFYAALTDGATPRVSAADGLAALQIALAADESARTGRPVRLEPLEVAS